MNDSIRRDAVLETVVNMRLRGDTNDIDEFCALLLECFAVLPTAEPRTGKWVLMSDCTGKYYACSWCGHDGYSGMDYCPNCGAKMEEESE